jgi:hypothetical protein
MNTISDKTDRGESNPLSIPRLPSVDNLLLNPDKPRGLSAVLNAHSMKSTNNNSITNSSSSAEHLHDLWRIHSKTNDFFGSESKRLEYMTWRRMSMMRSSSPVVQMVKHPPPQKQANTAVTENLSQSKTSVDISSNSEMTAGLRLICQNCKSNRKDQQWHVSITSPLILLCHSCITALADPPST